MAFDYAAKIQALLANADDENLSEAARAAYHAKAQELMRLYQIAEEEALASDPTSVKPIVRKIILVDRHSALSGWYSIAFGAIAHHTGVRYAINYSWPYTATVVGYEGDVRYTEFLWTAALLMFSTRIDPTWSDDLTEAENIYRLRNAGIERRRIADRAWQNGNEPAARSKVQRIYTRECARRGEEPRAAGLAHDTETYRYAYAQSFVDTLRTRLRDARDAVDSVHGALVLHGREDRVNEAFYELFPQHRPSDTPPAPATPCPKCAKAASGVCRGHKWNKSDEARWQRYNNSVAARAGKASGREAAEGVHIDRVSRPNRVEEGGPHGEIMG
jgi:hypothetical protein